ncbi:MAG TPA: hypothetical protein VIW67_08145, partial [Terriglobales bacterium]
QDDNSINDRLPGVSRNSYLGPDYSTTDLRITRRIYLSDKIKLDLMVESFNLFNRDNQKVDTSGAGFFDSAGQFVAIDNRIGINVFPAQFRQQTNFLKPADAYAPRQLQLALKLIY